MKKKIWSSNLSEIAKKLGNNVNLWQKEMKRLSSNLFVNLQQTHNNSVNFMLMTSYNIQ